MKENNSKCFSYLSNGITSINEALPNHDNKFKLTYDEKTLLPKITKKTLDIKYSDNAITASMLYFCGSETLFLDYFFTTRLFDYNYFPQSKYFLKRFKKQFDFEEKKISERFEQYYRIIVFQQLFFILHEVAHGLFFLYPNYKKEFLQIMDEDVSYYNRRISDFASQQSFLDRCQLAKKLWDKNKAYISNLSLRQIKTIATEINNQQYQGIDINSFKDKEKEELCCDLYSLLYFLEAHGKQQFENDVCNDFFIAAMTGIQLVERLVYLENRLIKQYDDDTYSAKSNLETPRVQIFSMECLLRHPSDDHNSFLAEVENKISTYFSTQINYVNEVLEILEQVQRGVVEINEEEKKLIQKDIDNIQISLIDNYINKAF